jgi:hypothetical protein
MNETRLFWLYVAGVYSAISSFGYLGFDRPANMAWLFFFASVGVAIAGVWLTRLEEVRQGRHFRSLVEAPDTSDELKDFCRWAIREFARNQRKRTFRYWKKQCRRLWLALREARDTSEIILPETEDPIKRNARAWRCSPVVAMKLHHLEKHVNDMAHACVMLRLADLEQKERWRTAKEWFALRDEWRKKISDPATPPELRAYCAQCLEELPQAPVLGPRYLA